MIGSINEGVRVRVIGAGLGRTGTASLKVALEMLGFGPCHHMLEVIGRPAVMERWIGVAERGDRDWDAIFAGYDSALDFPAVAYWRELVAHYPRAKVILTVRDPEEWYASARDTIFRLPLLLRRPVFGRVHRAWLGRRPAARTFIRMLEAIDRDRRDIDFRHDSAIDYFRRHNAAVQAEIPPERLLRYEVVDGWPPLCAFLDVPEPAVPFPRVNTGQEFRADLGRLLAGPPDP